MKKKILLITDNYNPSGGGAEKVFFTLKNSIEKNPKLNVFTLSFGDKNIEKKNLKIIKESENTLIRYVWRIFFNPIKYFQIKSFIKKVNPDVIHLHNINKYTISLLRALPKKIKVIYSVHDYGIVCPSMWNVHNDLSPCKTGFEFKKCLFKHKRDYNILTYLSLLYFFYKRKSLLKTKITHFVTATEKLATYINKQGFQNTKIIIYPVECFKNEKADFNQIDGNSFLYGGQLEENKGLFVLIEEFALALKTNNSLKLNIAGTGSLKETLLKRITELGIDNTITFLGWVNLNQYYKNNKCLIMPSLIQESFGLVIPEAMGYFRPAIGSNRGAIPDLIEEGITGYVFNPMKKGDLAEKILKIASKDISEMGKSARKTTLKYDSKKFVSAYVFLYLE